MQKIPVKKAIAMGQIWVNLPVTILMILVPVLYYLLMAKAGAKFPLLVGGLVLCIILSPFVAWIWWSFTIASWRIWAFKNVAEENWTELKNAAIASKLIWQDGSIYEKTEFRTKKQKIIISEVNRKISNLLNE